MDLKINNTMGKKLILSFLYELRGLKMSVDKIISHLHSYPSRAGPELGSGGIFGLKYYKKMLYYTLSFEGEAHFIKDYDEQIYNFRMVGKGPVSGGDTYNAVEVVDDYLYFGGWVHAPAIFKNGKISFKNKYAHLHEYNIEDDSLKLLWKDSIHKPTKWAGEVSDIIYDPYEDRLLLARQDGDENLGIYAIDRESGEEEKLSNTPSLKGEILHDSVFFASSDNFGKGLEKIISFDLIDKKWSDFNVENLPSLDGENVMVNSVGDVAALYNRLFIFTRGGIIIGNPLSGEKFKAARLFDFFTFQSPMRSNALYINGGVLVAYNAHHDAIYTVKSVEDKIRYTLTNAIVAPTLLVYITPPQIKIVASMGARVTSMETVGDKIVMGTNTTPNLGAGDDIPYDSGHRSFSIINMDVLQSSPPPVSISIPLELISLVMQKTKHHNFGGIPLDGYKNPEMVIYASKTNRLTISEYDLSLPLDESYKDNFTLIPGKNRIDLQSFSGIISFSLKNIDPKGKIKIVLQ
jgi:hypothetical protein